MSKRGRRRPPQGDGRHIMRFTTAGFASIAALGLVGCLGTGKISIGDDAKARVDAAEITAAKSKCDEARRPSICCRETACFKWLDDPFRACEPGFQNVAEEKDKSCSPP